MGITKVPNCVRQGSTRRYKLVWFKALVEEGTPVNLYQCEDCHKIVMDTERHIETEEENP